MTQPTETNPNNLPAAIDLSVMNQLVSGALGPLSHLQDTIDLTLDQVSDWIMQPYNRQQICNLVTILDAQTQLIICQQRLVAAARLAEVAATAQAPETVRRACSDLLKIRLIDPYLEDKRPEKMPPPPVYSQAEILATLERLGSTDGASGRPTESSESLSNVDANLSQKQTIRKTVTDARKS